MRAEDDLVKYHNFKAVIVMVAVMVGWQLGQKKKPHFILDPLAGLHHRPTRLGGGVPCCAVEHSPPIRHNPCCEDVLSESGAQTRLVFVPRCSFLPNKTVPAPRIARQELNSHLFKLLSSLTPAMEAMPKFVPPRSMWVSKLTLRCVTIGFDVIAVALAGTNLWFGFFMIGLPVSSSLYFLSLCLIVETDPSGFGVSLLVRRRTHLHY
jgi:hypothetical protein